MIKEFDWCGYQTMTEEQKREIETSIERTVKDRFDAELKPCHLGEVKVQLNIADPLLSRVVGNIRCSCGKQYIKFSTKMDSSSGTFERLEKDHNPLEESAKYENQLFR